MMLMRLAWRNVWRNRRRSLIVACSIGLGLAAMVFTESLSRGFVQQMLENQLGTHTGHIQVHARGWRDDQVMQNSMEKPAAVTAALRHHPAVAAFSERVMTFGLASSATNSAGVMIVGVEPDREPGVSTIKRAVVDGTYLTGARHEVLISRKLSETLDITLGDRLVAMASALDNSVASEMFRVVGIFQTTSSDFDRAHVYVPGGALQRMTGIGDRVSEVTVLLADIGSRRDVARSLRETLGDAYEVLTYEEILPTLVSQMEIAESSMVIFYAIIGLAMVFGIINTMLMSVFERIHEFGVIKSVGMNDGSLVRMVLLEAFILGAVGTASGTVVGVGVTAWLNRSGLDFSAFSEGLAAWGSSAVVYPVMSAVSVSMGAAVILCICLLAALYPAWKTARLDPIAAVRFV